MAEDEIDSIEKFIHDGLSNRFTADAICSVIEKSKRLGKSDISFYILSDDHYSVVQIPAIIPPPEGYKQSKIEKIQDYNRLIENALKDPTCEGIIPTTKESLRILEKHNLKPVIRGGKSDSIFPIKYIAYK